MSGRRIFVVEDEQIVSKDIQVRLKKLGYDIASAAASGEEALLLIEETQPDLILMDVMLKGHMLGTQAAEKIADQFDIPVIFLTAYTDQDTLDRATKTGAYGYVVKPIEDRQLQTAIDMALYKHQSEKEKLHLKEQLFQSQKLEAIGRLTAGVAHNFNNALHVIMGNLELAHRVASVEVVPFIERALKAIDDAAQVVKGLAAFSRNTSGHREIFDLCATVKHVTDMFLQTLKGEIGLVVSLDETPCWVCGDANQMQQVVLNLCLNARDAFMDKSVDISSSPRILVAMNQTQVKGCLYACVLVKDNGIGMEADVKQHIFEPFFTTKPVGQGTGLGLATAYGIVQNHRGWIECDSQPNQGTTFVVYLPLEKEKAQISQTPVTPQSVRKTDPLPVYSETLLVVDDEEIIRKTARDLLKLYGYRVIEAVDGPSGLAIYQTEKDRIDLVLMDLSMPGFSGLELLKRLLVINPEVRVIIMTGNLPDQMHVPDARAVLGKPLKSQEMFDVIRKALDEAS